jgi:formate hydrogenlyase subunit 3/multisubunit Na+/H+ antiporter MnhD subunit
MNDHDHRTPAAGSGDERAAERAAERADRKWADALQELRVMQTGVQLTAGFLLTLPFQDPFADLDSLQRATYLALVVLAGVTTTLVLTPVAVHRRLTGLHVKERVVRTAHRIMTVAMVFVAVLVVGITTFVFDVVVSRPAAAVVAVAMSALAVGLLVVLPARAAGND